MKHLRPLLSQFAALSLRERMLAIVAFLGVAYFVIDFAVIRPQQTQAKVLRAKITQQEVEISAFSKALQALSAPAKVDPLAKQRAERDELRNSFAEAEALIAHASANVRIGEVIRSMAAARPGLALTSLKTLPVETFFRGSLVPAASSASTASSSLSASGAAVPALYKHGIEVTVQGSYPALVAYMQELERNGAGIFWGNVKLDVVAYPDSSLKMTIYTLSARPELPLG